MPKSAGLNNKPHKKPSLLAACFMQVSFHGLLFTLKMEATCSSTGFHHNAQRFVQEGIMLHNHHCQILRPYMSTSDQHTCITPNTSTVGYFRIFCRSAQVQDQIWQMCGIRKQLYWLNVNYIMHYSQLSHWELDLDRKIRKLTSLTYHNPHEADINSHSAGQKKSKHFIVWRFNIMLTRAVTGLYSMPAESSPYPRTLFLSGKDVEGRGLQPDLK